jgi:hypothetical protein
MLSKQKKKNTNYNLTIIHNLLAELHLSNQYLGFPAGSVCLVPTSPVASIFKKLKQVEQPTSPFAITTPSLEKHPFFAVKWQWRFLFRASNFFNVHPFLQLT